MLYELHYGRTPFAHHNRLVIFKQIIAARTFLSGSALWPAGLDADAKQLTLALLSTTPTARPGAGKAGADELQRHAWFAKSGFDFDALAARRVAAPLVPVIASALDAENFNMDACDEDEGVAPFEGDQSIYDDWSEGYVQFPAPGPDA